MLVSAGHLSKIVKWIIRLRIDDSGHSLVVTSTFSEHTHPVSQVSILIMEMIANIYQYFAGSF